MGKYDAVMKNLKKLPPIDAAWQARVDAVKQSILEVAERDFDLKKLDAHVNAHLNGITVQIQELHVLMLNAVGGEHKSPTFARVYRELRKIEDVAKDHLSQIELVKTAYEQLLVDCYEAEGVRTVKLDSGETIRTQPEPYGQVVDKEAFRKWCHEEGLGTLMQLPWQSMNSLVKERLLEGQNEPPGVTAFVRTKAKLRKA